MSITEAGSHTWKQKVKTYLAKNFTKKLNLWRLIFFGIGVLVILATALPMELWVISAPKSVYWSGKFIEINIQLNDGISFGMFSGSVALIYFLQIFIVLILLGIYIFIKKKYYQVFVSFAICGGIYNLLDRMVPKELASLVGYKYYNSVLDYFSFYGKTAIFNFSDVFVLVGIIGFCVLLVIMLIVDVVKDSKKEKENGSTNNK